MLLLDFVLRGGGSALLALIALVLLRDRRESGLARLGAAFACGVIVHVWRTAPGFSALDPRIAIPVIAVTTGNTLLFWLLARRIFDDGFALRPWHGAAWGLIVLLQVANQLGAGSQVLGPLLTIQAPAFATLALIQTVRTWRDDLMERRRRLRVFVVLASAVYILASAVPDLGGARPDTPGPGNLFGAIALLAASLIVAAGLLRLAPESQPARPPLAQPLPDAAEEALLGRLRRVMDEERLHRDERLTVAKLAARLSVPDYRLRRLINQRLGHANFQAFVNGYRLAEAKAALADPGQAEVPILTIALDAGFGSLAPFNRAFKAQAGVTPGAYRKATADRISKSDEP